MKNSFYFMVNSYFKALFVFEISTFLSCPFGYVGKRIDKKAMVNFKIYDIGWIINNYNSYVAQYLKK